MSLADTMRALYAAGATTEVLIAFVEVEEAKREAELAHRRAKDAARKRKPPVDSTEIRGNPRNDVESAKPPPHVGAGAPVVTPFSSSLRSEEVGGGGVERERAVPSSDDWPEGRASDHADQLVALVASPWLDPSKSPDLVTTRGRVAAWKRDGASWEHDVLPVVTGLCANRRSKISTWKFFDDAVARSIAENRAALEIPEACGRRQTGPPGWVDQIAAVNAEARRRVLEAD